MMKRIVTLVVILAMALMSLALAACSIENDEHTANADSSTAASETTSAPAESNTDAPAVSDTEPVTEAHVHAFGEWSVTTAATCTEKGTETRTCACGETETRDVEALGHQEVSDDTVAVEPTCFTTGMTVGTHCERCGAVVKAAEEIPAAPHEYDEYQRCSRCGTIAGLRYDSKGDGTCWLVHPTDDGNSSFDENVNYEDYGFTVENGTLVVPTVSPDGEKVVRLGDGAFCGCPSIVNIIVPDGIRVKGYNFGCPNVKNIYISAGTDMDGCGTMCGDAHDQRVVATIYTGYDSVSAWDPWWDREAHLTVECGVTLEQFYSIIGQ